MDKGVIYSTFVKFKRTASWNSHSWTNIQDILAKPGAKIRLRSHMRTGRQGLTQQFVHSFARCDYTSKELRLDRRLRKEAGERES
ncbi:unnamed protein product [Nippostrongylus brasiliensis]|uniref:60S ribosomal protein L35a n=1 Tax=Nippostrongylus brasiliensis TaxID=27835 RepID=A0A0N4XZ74_NIPBR|nr:unnamed protein product [Nippostrongylus brasiliensis]